MPALTDALQALDARQRDCLVVLALDTAPALSRTAWQERVAQAGIADDRGRRLAGEPFHELVRGLLAAGAADVTARHEQYLFKREWTAPLLDDALQRNALADLVLRLGTVDRRSYSSRGIGAKGQLLVALASNQGGEAAERAFERHIAFARDANDLILDALGFDLPLAWLARLSPDLRARYLKLACHVAYVSALRLGSGVRAAALEADDPEIRARITTLVCLEGDHAQAETLLAKCGTSQWERGARAFAAFTRGDVTGARTLFAEAAVGSRKQRVELPAYLAAFDLLLTVTSDDHAAIADLPRRLERAKRQLAESYAAYLSLDQLVRFRQTGRAVDPMEDGFTWADVMLCALRDAWTGIGGRARNQLGRHAERAKANGYLWLTSQLQGIAADSTVGGLLGLYEPKEGWQLALDALASASLDHRSRTTPATLAGPEGGVIWWTLELGPAGARPSWFELEARLVTKPGSKGKSISIARALADSAVALGDDDRRVVDAFMAARQYGGLDDSFTTLLSLVDHPRVRDEQGQQIRVERGEPTLHVIPTADGATMRFVPAAFDDEGIAVERAADGGIKVYRRSAVAERILEVLSEGELHVPTQGLARMSEILGALGTTVRVEAAASLVADGGTADPRIHVQLFRAGIGLRARLRVVPGGEVGPALRPFQAPAVVMINAGSSLVRLSRDLREESLRHEELLARCPTLASLPQEGDDRVASDLATCLELLVELREADCGVVEWLQGQPLRAPSVRGASSVRVDVRAESTWLAIEGELRIDESRVVAMKELLASCSRAVGRFIPLGDDEYVALTEDLRAKLDALARVQQLGRDGRLSTALLPAVDSILSGLDVTFAASLEKKRAAFDMARTLEPKIPRGLAAELRDYQREGFMFLVRRAEAGLGACLADDMGLGKTVQALALLLHRRKKGPALVVAPTSVCRNWESEATRFAPSLAVHRLADGDREACVKNASAGDVVITSYGLLASETELLASRTWSTVIYDEAHALKNASTRRWAAARDMKSDAVVALTGTPVENHAGELHALFDLLVPGMLGSRSLFDSALGARIASGDREAAALLRQLVRPFVLRRTKGQVLGELPPKTEVLQAVTASSEHRAFYEAVRQRAVAKIDDARKAGGAKAGRARFELLAEITRLRRAAIDPRLVGGADAPHGSKLDALVELVLELREEGRRALVFSQFLEVLDLARGRLEERGVECLRLDGTMSQSVRADATAAFQDGKGDVFLVSLKAGGVGMNFTGADVVILLDPWWNPAVEDQAASRSHRMGQTRPVTVVRIVTEGTIEEKVLSLHARKRQLFDDVVADADGGGTLDVDTIAMLLT